MRQINQRFKPVLYLRMQLMVLRRSSLYPQTAGLVAGNSLNQAASASRSIEDVLGSLRLE